MITFADVVKTLPAIEHIAKLELYEGETLIDTLENKPGKSGSVAVYNALAQEFGSLNKAAATKGLILFAEHTADAQSHPGKHPNIDRLFAIIEGDGELRIQTVTH